MRMYIKIHMDYSHRKQDSLLPTPPAQHIYVSFTSSSQFSLLVIMRRITQNHEICFIKLK